MTNVSKRELDPHIKQKLFKQFALLFVMVGEKKMGTLFVELFTEAEQIMFIKRVGIILLLSENRSNYAIAKALEVSEATVRATKVKYIAGEYKNIAGAVRQQGFDSDKFWSVMEVVLRGGLPPKTGPGRWKYALGKNN